jgi:hypothetical protein
MQRAWVGGAPTASQICDALGRDLEATPYVTVGDFRQYDAADPANRLVAGELEACWYRALARVDEVEGKIAAHEATASPPTIDPAMLGGQASPTREKLFPAIERDESTKRQISQP